MPIISEYVSLPRGVVARIVALRMRECLCPNTIATRLALPASTVRSVLAREGIQ